MQQDQKKILFYTFLVIIVLVNGVLTYGLIKHFVLDRPVKEIDWLLCVFGAEVMGCFVYAWKELFKSGTEHESITQTDSTIVPSSEANLAAHGSCAKVAGVWHFHKVWNQKWDKQISPKKSPHMSIKFEQEGNKVNGTSNEKTGSIFVYNGKIIGNSLLLNFVQKDQPTIVGCFVLQVVARGSELRGRTCYWHNDSGVMSSASFKAIKVES